MRSWLHLAVGFLLALLAGCGNRSATPYTSPQVFVGEIAGSDALLALVVEQGRFLAYSCGGPESWRQLTGWFEGELQGGSVPPTSGSYGLLLKASPNGAGWDGSLEAEGRTYRFTLSPAKADSPAGLYILDNEAREAGLIIANNLKTAGVYYGKQSGVTAAVQVKDDLTKITTKPTELTVTSPAYGGSEFTLSSTTRVQASPVEPRLPIPVNLHRIAAQMLEETRGTEMAPGWSGTARLAGKVNPFYRPDISTPAYYELPVLPQGLILLSNGEHDYPIAHWSDEESMSTRLEASAKNQTLVRYWKLDSMYYVGEDGQGNRVSSFGTPVMRIEGASFDQPAKTYVATAQPINPQAEDTDPTDSKFVIKQDPLPNLTYRPWASWRELKAGYFAAYKPWLERLAQRARHDWDIEKAAQRNGEGLLPGNKYSIATLYPGVRFSTDKDVSPYVSFELKRSSDARVPDTLVITVRADAPETIFNLRLAYRNGVTESLRYAVVHSQSIRPASLQAQAQSSWSEWTVFKAGNTSDQPIYDQFPHPTKPCVVGCVPTAWTMLFGWADRQAALGHPRWKNRKGIYREDGGRTGGAVAPIEMTQGIRNVMLELHHLMGTFCVDGEGGTYRSDYIRAAGYLEGRTAASLRVEQEGFLVPQASLRERVRNSIRNLDTPVVVGLTYGGGGHAALAYKYRYRTRIVQKLFWEETEYQREFKINLGWGPREDNRQRPRTDWVPAEAGIVGEIIP